jgi:hypothetical protein
MNGDSMAFSEQIRRAAGVGVSPIDDITAARQRLEAPKASGDPSAIEQATREGEELTRRLEGGDVDFGGGAGRPVPTAPSMSDAIRAAWKGEWTSTG